MAQQKEMILGIWTNVAKMVIAKTDLSAEDQEKYIADTLAFDAILGGLVKTREEWSEYVKIYNPMKASRVSSFLKTVNFKKILKSLFDCIPETIIVTEPRYFKNFVEVFNEETFELYKHWAYVNAILASCDLLSEELRELGGMYYRAIAGIKAGTPIEKFAYNLASGMYSEPVGLYYGEKYFGEEAKKDITEIVYQSCMYTAVCQRQLGMKHLRAIPQNAFSSLSVRQTVLHRHIIVVVTPEAIVKPWGYCRCEILASSLYLVSVCGIRGKIFAV
jgi:predicted metalloendopeptidase